MVLKEQGPEKMPFKNATQSKTVIKWKSNSDRQLLLIEDYLNWGFHFN